jgi:hypothetical protein
MTPDEFKRVTDVTYLGCVHGTWAALQHMREHDRGLIIQVGSALAYRGIPLQSAYCGAKYAIRGFTEALHSELVHQRSRIKLMMIQLPAVNTPQFDWARTHMPRAPRPVPPVLQPEVIAEAIYKASLHPRREYWIGRSTLEVILANMALPGFLDRVLAYKAYRAQMTRWPARSWRRDNLEAPVHALHRTHGSFDREAGREALLVGGEVARLGSGLAAMAVAYCAVALAKRALSSRSTRSRRSK